jgi:hypothetical protein
VDYFFHSKDRGRIQSLPKLPRNPCLLELGYRQNLTEGVRLERRLLLQGERRRCNHFTPSRLDQRIEILRLFPLVNGRPSLQTSYI